MIHQLEERKYEAVNTEHFDNARKLKLAIDKLIVGGQSLGALEAQKRAFADNQDYNLFVDDWFRVPESINGFKKW